MVSDLSLKLQLLDTWEWWGLWHTGALDAPANYCHVRICAVLLDLLIIMCVTY